MEILSDGGELNGVELITVGPVEEEELDKLVAHLKSQALTETVMILIDLKVQPSRILHNLPQAKRNGLNLIFRHGRLQLQIVINH